MAHAYGDLLTEADPRAAQPPRVYTTLKPCQLAELAKAKAMELESEVRYMLPYEDGAVPSCGITTNVGILGSPAGAGKTLTALGIVAATPAAHLRAEQQRVVTHGGRSSTGGVFRATCAHGAPPNVVLVNTTLIVAANAVVHRQWQADAQHHTSLRCLFIERGDAASARNGWPASVDGLPAFLQAYDAIIVTVAALQRILYHYVVAPERVVFARIVVDDAHNSMSKVPRLGYRFLWLISHHALHLRSHLDHGIGATARACR